MADQEDVAVQEGDIALEEGDVTKGSVASDLRSERIEQLKRRGSSDNALDQQRSWVESAMGLVHPESERRSTGDTSSVGNEGWSPFQRLKSSPSVATKQRSNAPGAMHNKTTRYEAHPPRSLPAQDTQACAPGSTRVQAAASPNIDFQQRVTSSAAAPLVGARAKTRELRSSSFGPLRRPGDIDAWLEIRSEADGVQLKWFDAPDSLRKELSDITPILLRDIKSIRAMPGKIHLQIRGRAPLQLCLEGDVSTGDSNRAAPVLHFYHMYT